MTREGVDRGAPWARRLLEPAAPADPVAMVAGPVWGADAIPEVVSGEAIAERKKTLPSWTG
jgi:hypothetical protein